MVRVYVSIYCRYTGAERDPSLPVLTRVLKLVM